MPLARHPWRGAAAALAALATLSACGLAPDGGAQPPLRVSPEGPLPAVGSDERAPAQDDGGSPPAAPDGLATLVATLPARTVVRPRPDLPDPPRRPSSAGSEPRARLTGRSAAGTGVVELPLSHTRVVAQVSGNVARVEVTQLYVNTSTDRLEAIYAFPLPPNAAVTDMAFRIGNRLVVSEVKRRGEARRTYEAARAQGRTAALTEQERPNLFTQSVANVPPGDTVAVLLRYVHEVPYDDGRYLFHFPTTIGPRYVPGTPAGGRSGPGWAADTDRVPDASRVTPPVLPEGQRPAADVDVLVRLVPAAAFEDVVAKSHRVVTGVDGEGARLVALAEDDRVPNADLVLSWRPAGEAPGAHALVQREQGEEFLLLFLQPPADVAPALVRPKELVFLVDKSGSMTGAPIERAKALVDRALGALGPDDTFQLVAFDGAAQAMTAAPVPGTADNVARAKAWLSRLSGGGGTEMLAGIRAALQAPADPRRLRMVVFCTDGFIANEAEIIEAVAALRGSARVFGFGVGTSVNRYLVEGVGRAGRGASEIVNLTEPPAEAVTRLFRRLDRPVLTDLDVTFEAGAVSDLLPGRLPDLLAGQPLVLAGRVQGGAPRTVILRGRLGDRPYEARVPIAVASPAADGRAPAQPVAGTLWARRRVDDLLAGPATPAPEAVEEVVGHALRFKLVTPYTSFVAVERELRVDPSLPLASVAVPNELPDGVSREGIFGAASVEILPARVKPGDPELRVQAAPTAAAVRVALPFEPAPRDALRDDARGDWVLRFLVPPGWPDGSWDARIAILHRGGEVEERTAPIRVDTTAAAVAVLSAPAAAARGEEVRLSLKPALPLARVAGLAGRRGGLANAVKGAIEAREVLVRAPWGEVVRARMQGPLGAYEAVLHVPHHAAEGAGELEIAASDAAGNVSRRKIPLRIHAGRAHDREMALAGVGGAASVAAVITAAFVLLGAAWKERERVRHLALPVLADPSLPPAPAVELPELAGSEVREVARVPARVTALLRPDGRAGRIDGTALPAPGGPAGGGGALFIGTFDSGLLRLAAGDLSALPGLAGRELFVNALAEHDGLVWVATQGGLVAIDGDRRVLTLLGGEGVTSLARGGSALYAGTTRGVFRISVADGAESLHALGPSGEPLRVTALAAGPSRLWIGTASGAYSLPLAVAEAPLLARTAAWHPLVFGDPPAETNVVTALVPFAGGALAGTDDGGVVRLRDDGGVAALRFRDPRANEVNAGAAAVAGGVALLGTQGAGLVVTRPAGAGVAAARLAVLAREQVSAVALDGDRILVGSADGTIREVVLPAGASAQGVAVARPP